MPAEPEPTKSGKKEEDLRNAELLAESEQVGGLQTRISLLHDLPGHELHCCRSSLQRRIYDCSTIVVFRGTASSGATAIADVVIPAN